MIIPGILISIVTFPGVIVHELAHQIFCYIFKVPVYSVKYFQVQNPCGYVLHEASDKPLTTFMISVGPFIVNTLIGMLILIPFSISLAVAGRDSVMNFPLHVLTGWLGISVLMHAFPSIGDAGVLAANILKNRSVNILVKILTAPVILLIYIGALGSIVWLDFFYAIGITFLLPKILGLFL